MKEYQVYLSEYKNKLYIQIVRSNYDKVKHELLQPLKNCTIRQLYCETGNMKHLVRLYLSKEFGEDKAEEVHKHVGVRIT